MRFAMRPAAACKFSTANCSAPSRRAVCMRLMRQFSVEASVPTDLDPGPSGQFDFAERAARSPDNQNARIAVEVAKLRTVLFVPLRKDDVVVGRIAAGRQEARPFTDKQIALLQNFAAQAVIAMENARLLTETREALEQQTATAEVLQVINSSPGDLAPVFDAILEKAHALCGAEHGSLERTITIIISATWRRAVTPSPWWSGYGEDSHGSTNPVTRPLIDGARFVHIPDFVEIDLSDPTGRRRARRISNSSVRAAAKGRQAARSHRRYRQEVRPFAEKEVALLENFAAQAVIAMENARLLTETREALEYQTAVSDVLRVISSSAFDLDPILQTVVTTAVRLCRANSATIYRNVDGEYRWAAGHMLSPEYEVVERAVRIGPGTGTVVGRTVIEGRTVQILDAWTDPLYEAKEDARIGGVHTMIGVPLLREGVAIGVIGLARRRIEAFSEREIQLVTTFADQAVIAIENARLLNDLQQRTSDLQESLEYQTATSDVLKVISQSGAELEPVLQTLVETAARICEADKAVLQQLRGGSYRMVASFGFMQEFKDYRARNPITPDRGTPIGRMTLDRRVVHIEDALSDPEFTDFESQRLGEFRTMLGVPLFREDTIVGGLFLARSRVEPFSEKQIALVRTFAAQAVIAIENARLLGRTARSGRRSCASPSTTWPTGWRCSMPACTWRRGTETFRNCCSCRTSFSPSRAASTNTSATWPGAASSARSIPRPRSPGCGRGSASITASSGPAPTARSSKSATTRCRTAAWC